MNIPSDVKILVRTKIKKEMDDHTIRSTYKCGVYGPPLHYAWQGKFNEDTLDMRKQKYKECIKNDTKTFNKSLKKMSIPSTVRKLICQSKLIRRYIYYHEQLTSVFAANTFKHWKKLEKLLEQDHAVCATRTGNGTVEFCQFVFNTPKWFYEQTGEKIPCKDPHLCTLISVEWDYIRQVHAHGVNNNT
uniref:Uncharacterized protein n=1 Tax=Clandestinovirus TaxID=2831644 RepID=A0A8F8KLF1_9VIRU|nr:hypothetical protein KOM_12_255 [Clandestinovirus]